jgi:hypothetical protein
VRRDRAQLAVAGVGVLAALAFATLVRRRATGCQVDFTGAFSRPVDDYAPVAQLGCDPTAKPGVLAFRSWVLDGVGGQREPLNIVRACEIGGPSKHHEGRAWDWFPPSKAVGDALVTCLTSPDETGVPDAMARRAGLRTIIWQRRIWIANKGWGPYTKPGGDPHTSHVHFGFGWPGALGQTSLYDVVEGGMAAPTAEVTMALPGEPTVIELLNVPGLATTSRAFKRKAVTIASGMGLDPSLLLAVMSFETAGTFDPAIKNPHSGAVGLIQFTKKWASIVVGKTVEELGAMSAVEQLDYVEAWYRYHHIYLSITEPRDYYLAVFAPTGIGKPESFPLYVAPSQAYEQNKAMDADVHGARARRRE